MKITMGPIPSPEILEKYQAIDPSLPSQIIAQAWEEGNHRRQKEIKVLEQDERNSKRDHREVMTGHITGFLVAAGFLGTGILLMYSGISIP